MKMIWKIAAVLAISALLPWSGSAQIEKITDATYRDHLNALPGLSAGDPADAGAPAAVPEKGDLWDFENIHWSRFGGHSWNGIKTIHGRSSWGKLAFEISDDQMRRIKRSLIAKARKAYLQEKRTTHTYHGEVDRWAKDLYAGDPDFYKAKVAPLIRQLDSYLPLVTVEMDDATVDKLFHEAVPGWFEIRFKVSDLRKDYLEDSLFQ